MNIKILPYIDQTEYLNNNTSALSRNSNQVSGDGTGADGSFADALSTAKKVTAAMAIDTLVSASNSGQVDPQLVQNFFNQNGINITLSAGQTSSASSTYQSGTASAATGSTVSASYHQTSAGYSNSGSLACSDQLESIFEEAAEKYNIDIKLLKAVAKTESDFDPNATSSAGAMGIMQLMPCNVEEYNVSNAYDPYENIMAGANQLSGLLSYYNDDLTLALAAYNAGSGNVRKYGGVPPFKETQNYIVKVTNLYNS